MIKAVISIHTGAICCFTWQWIPYINITLMSYGLYHVMEYSFVFYTSGTHGFHMSLATCSVAVSKISTGPTHFSFSEVYRSFIPNKTTFTMYCLTHQISKLPRSFEIHWVRQYLINFIGLGGLVTAAVYRTAKFHRSWAWQIVLIFDTAIGFMVPSGLLYCEFT